MLAATRFRGIPQLEACAVDDSAHLTAGASGSHVALIQQALLDLGESLPAGADGQYGQQTVNAVTNYKVARGISNASGQIDGIVGKLTIASLDAEIDQFDITPGPCPPDTDGPAVDALGNSVDGMNAVLGFLGVGRLLDVADAGATRLTLGAEIVEPTALVTLAAGSARLLSGDGSGTLGLADGLTALAASPPLAGFPDVVSDLGAAAPQVASLGSGRLLLDFLFGLPGNSPPAARDMAQDAALAEVVAAHQAGTIVLSVAPTFDATGNFLTPKPGDTLTLGSSIAAVNFMFVNFADRTRPNYKPAAVALANVDARHLVGLIRLAQHLAGQFGVTEVHHVGIGGQGAAGTECHTQGRACDFVGARGVANGQPFLLTVLNDWALHSVPNLVDPAKPRLPDWPHRTVGSLSYRLTDPVADTFARDFFQDVYDFVAGEYQDRTAGVGQTTPASAIGQTSFVMSPDHPTSDLGGKHGREAHRSHIHFQIGPTGNAGPPRP